MACYHPAKGIRLQNGDVKFVSQLLIDGTTADCGCCDPCRAVRSLADRQRKFYWLKRLKGAAHG